MNKRFAFWSFHIILTVLMLCLWVPGCGGGGGGGGGSAPPPITPTASPSPTGTVSPSPSPTITPSPSPDPTETPDPPEPTGTIQGNVSSFYTGSDISGVLVTITRRDDQDSTFTDDSGFYRFSGQGVGDYSMLLSRGGYFNAGRDVSVLQNQTVNEDFHLMVMPGQGTWTELGERDISDGIAGFCTLLTADTMVYAAYSDLTLGAMVMAYDRAGASPQWNPLGSPVTTDETAFHDLKELDGDIYLAYTDVSFDGKCTLHRFNDENWEMTGPRGFTDDMALGISLAFLNGRPCVAYSDGADLSGIEYRASVMHFDGTDWDYLGTRGFSSGEASYPSLRDINGQLYIAYVDHDSSGPNENGVTVMKYDEGSSAWVLVGDRQFSDGGADFVSLESSLGQPWVAYSDDSLGGKIVVMRFDGTSWQPVGNKGFSSGKADYIDFVIQNQVPYVIFADEGDMDRIKVMRFDGGDWVRVGVPGFASLDDWRISMAVQQGTPYFIFEDNSSARATVMQYLEP